MQSAATTEQDDAFTSTLSDILSVGWGPTNDAIPSFGGVPFTPFNKRDPINYVANWEGTTWASRGPSKAKFGDDHNAGLGMISDDDNADTFEGAITVKKKSYETIAKYRRDRTSQRQQLNYAQSQAVIKEQQQLQNAPTSRRGTRKQQQNKRRRKKYIENPRPIVSSIKKNENWIDFADVWFRETFEQDTTKSIVFKIDGVDEPKVYAPRSKKLILAGLLHGVLTRYDSKAGNTYKPSLLDYERFSQFRYVSFNHKAATQDPYILELAQKPSFASAEQCAVFTTDNVMSTIMCCVRSKYSFDIVINKIGNKIFLDERNKVLSVESVDETSQNRPTKKGTSKINLYTSLAQEATAINQVFKEQMVYHSSLEYTQKLKRPHPFSGNAPTTNSKSSSAQQLTGNQVPSSQAFSYNMFEVTDDLNVVCRCEIDGFMTANNAGGGGSKKSKDWVKIHALNQYDSNRSKTQNWKKYLQQRDSTIVIQEIANNNFKCARWGMKAHLADAKYIKLGFVARHDMNSVGKHVICGVKTYETNDFIRKILRITSKDEPWTIFAKFIKCIQNNLEADGRYIAVRDPLKQFIRLYKVQDDAFSKDDGLPTFNNLRKALNIPQDNGK